MLVFVSVIHALTCIFVILFILLQDPKGGVLGSLGSGSKSFFGAEGASPFLVKATKWLAIIFASTSFYLSFISSEKDSSLMATPDPIQQEQTLPESPDNTTTPPPSKTEKSPVPPETKAPQETNPSM